MNASTFYARTVTDPETGCMEWQGASSPTGYGKVRYEGKAQDTHRVSWMITNGDIPAGMMICHKCDNRICVNPNHLFVGTRSDNMRDAWNKGRLDMSKALENHPTSIPDASIIRAHELLEQGVPAIRIAAMCGISRQTVGHIKYLRRPRYARLIGEVA